MSLDMQQEGTEGGAMDAGAVPTSGARGVVRGEGRSPEEAFEQAAVALCARVTDPAAVEVREEVEVQCEAPDLERLLADWLGAVVHNMAARRLRFRCFAVRMDGKRLFGHAFGEHVDRTRHADGDLRRVLFRQPRVRRDTDGRWTAECEVEL